MGIDDTTSATIKVLIDMEHLLSELSALTRTARATRADFARPAGQWCRPVRVDGLFYGLGESMNASTLSIAQTSRSVDHGAPSLKAIRDPSCESEIGWVLSGRVIASPVNCGVPPWLEIRITRPSSMNRSERPSLDHWI
jgi:hypothetical protein